MPVLRQDVQTGSGQLQLGNTNYMVGTAAPTMKQVQPEVDSRGMAIQNFLQGFLGQFQPQVQQGQTRAAAQGQIDAAADPNALQDSDDAASKQNIFMRDAYRQGYLGAAIQQSVNDFQAGAQTRAQQAGVQGLSDETFLAQERQHSAQLLNTLGQSLQHVSPETQQAVAQSLDNTKTATLNMLRKARAGQASINNTRTIEQGTYQASQNFLQSFANAGFDQSWHYIQDQADMIATNPLMKQDEKEQQLQNLAVITAQQMNDPQAIAQLADKFDGLLGANSVATHKALYTAFNEAGQRTAGASIMDVQNRLDAISQMPVYQQADARTNLEQHLVELNSTGQLSTGQMLSFYKQMHKQQKPEDQLKGLVNTAASSHGALSVESLHSSSSGQVSYDQIHSAITNAYPDTVQGNAAMMAAGQAGGDAWIIKTALGRMGTQMTDQLSTLSVNMQVQTDENGNKTYTVPEAVRDNLMGFTAMYKSGDAITKQTLMNTLPDDWKGIIQSAIAQDPTNANNNVLDTVKRVASERASGMYKDVPQMPTGKTGDAVFNTDAALSWYQRINPITTASEASQRAQFGQELQAEYARIRNEDPALLSGKSPQTINQMLVGSLQARTVGLTVGNFNTSVILPVGTSLDQYAQAAGTDAGSYQKGIQAAATSAMEAQGFNPDRVDRVRIDANAGGANSRDLVLTVDTKNDAGVYESHRINLPMQSINAQAQGTYQDLLAGQRADGENKAGTNLVTFYDHSSGGYRTGPISGPNSAGMNADDFNRLQANTMRYEGFKGSKSNGSVGYGWHDASGDNVPDRITPQGAAQQLRTLLQDRYVPMAKQYSKDAGLRGDYSLGMLSDMAYQRPADAKAMASAMGQFQRGELTYPDLINTLKKLPSWSDAGGGANTARNKDRLQNLQLWSTLEGNRGARPEENPFGTIGQQQ